MLGCRLREVRLRRTAGVVDQYVEAAEGPLGELDHLPRAGLGCYVGPDKGSATDLSFDAAYGLRPALLVNVSDDDRRTLF